MNSRELPLDRLATTDQKGNRVYLYPSDVKGKFRKYRSALSVVLLAIFLILPWIRIGGHQALLLDISQRRFSIFGLLFWGHDAPMLIFVFGGALLALALVTAIWGRVWCGWACPQTVFIDSVFRRIERWIEGDWISRKKLDASPLDSKKLLKKTLKWSLFTGASLIISHSFLAYFVGTERLAEMIQRSPWEHPTAFLFMAGLTGFVLFDFGWFREQFCTVLCPYARFQSVLMDDRSMVVGYDVKRGEPRRGAAPTSVVAPTAPATLVAPVPDSQAGDCVNCYRCVQVCPTGIDIRRGVQMECIACTACMDACDEVMLRLKKPEGLIRYTTGSKEPKRKLGARPLAYIALLLAFAGGLVFTVSNRTPIEASWVRAVGKPYQEIAQTNGTALEVVNHFRLGLRNQSFDDLKVTIALDPGLVSQGFSVVVSNHSAILPAGASERADAFIRFPVGALEMGKRKLSVQVLFETPEGRKDVLVKEVTLVGPLR